MLYDGKIMLGAGYDGPDYLVPEMAIRHGLISGAIGAGKTICLKILAEGFSELGIPVLLTDIKGDLSGMVACGNPSVENNERLRKCGIDPDRFEYRSYATNFWDAFGNAGHPVRAVVGGFSPLLMARMLELNEIQTDALEIVYKISKDEDFILDDLYDLSALLYHIGSNPDKYYGYGRLSPETIGVIQRQVGVLMDRGGIAFFGRPNINVFDWLQNDPETGFGTINILNAKRLYVNSHMYSAFLLWLLEELCRVLPDHGESEKPRLVVFLEEADLLFKWTASNLVSRIEQILRLMRSKGVGLYMLSWNPLAIPTSVNRQLHNRILLSMNAYTPYEKQNVVKIAKGFPSNPRFDVAREITLMGKGEALVSFMDKDGRLDITRKITILPPQSYIGSIGKESIATVIKASPFNGRYDEVIDYYSAYEKLQAAEYIPIMN